MRFLQLAAKEREDGMLCSDNDCIKMPKNGGKGGGIWALFEKMGFYRKCADSVKSRKNRHEKVPQRPDRPLRDVYFDTICDFLELLQMDYYHPHSLVPDEVRGALFQRCIVRNIRF